MKNSIIAILLLACLWMTSHATDSRRDFLIHYCSPSWPQNTDSCNPSGSVSSFPYTIPTCDPATDYSDHFGDSLLAVQFDSLGARYVFGIAPSGAFYDSTISRNENYKALQYNSFQDNTNGSTEDDWLEDTLIALGENPERAYLHYYDNTTNTIGSFTGISVAADSADSVDSRARVYSTTRYVVNYSDSLIRTLTVGFQMDQFRNVAYNEGSYSTHYWKGVFWDNSAPEFYNFGGAPSSGGHIAEAPDHMRIDSIGSTNFDWWYDSCLAPFHQEFVDSIGSTYWSCLNTGNTASRMYTDDIATHFFWEFAPRTVGNQRGQVETLYRFDSACAANGIAVCYSPASTNTYSGYDGELTEWDAMQANLCWFYISCSDSAYFYQQNVNGPSNFLWDSVMWHPAMNQDIGSPVGIIDTLQSGTDPRSQPYIVHSREYDSALVILRTRIYNEHFDSTTAVTVNLGDTYYELCPDGTRNSGVTSVDIINCYGKIMMKNGDGEGSPASRRKLKGMKIIGGKIR